MCFYQSGARHANLGKQSSEDVVQDHPTVLLYAAPRLRPESSGHFDDKEVPGERCRERKEVQQRAS